MAWIATRFIDEPFRPGRFRAGINAKDCFFTCYVCTLSFHLLCFQTPEAVNADRAKHSYGESGWRLDVDFKA